MGETLEPFIDGDTLYFSNGDIDRKYFEQNMISTEIKNKNFKFTIELTYPHKFMVNLKSEYDDVLVRGGDYFVDGTSKMIVVDSIGECSTVEGRTNEEFKNIFIPFIFKEEQYDCKKRDLSNLRYSNSPLFEQRLFDYVEIYPNSYVGLWFLIAQLENEGYSPKLEKALQSFSIKIKEEGLWKLVQQTLDSIEIRKDRKFPVLMLKDTVLKSQKLELPEAKFILVDYWFSSCRPCLEAFPKLKQLYGKFHNLGFEIISISVDKTEDVVKWRQRIKEKELNWPQYLDENGKDAQMNKVVFFPTTFLLDANGVIIEKNIPLETLEKLLEKNL